MFLMAWVLSICMLGARRLVPRGHITTNLLAEVMKTADSERIRREPAKVDEHWYNYTQAQK